LLVWLQRLRTEEVGCPDKIQTVKNNYKLVKIKQKQFFSAFSVLMYALLRLIVMPARQKIRKSSLNYTDVCSSS